MLVDVSIIPTSGVIAFSARVSAAGRNHSVLGPFNLLATLGLLAIVVGAVPLVARHQHFQTPSLRWAEPIPSWVFVGLAALGLAAVLVAYAVLY